ncbi:MAG: DegT/DnrJ/EryC1/StrS family aminotransferase, partial [Oscillospiraceae bacterium]|nr:DegT/DnrJ/EryC1/StrS family aminotransferase [Oscillospiraceae bacterium]
MLEQKILDVLASGVWGTIGPKSVSAAAALAEHVGAKYGLLCHSAGAACEAVLRHFGAAGGDKVLCGEVCDPMDPLTAVCVGAEPVFVPCSGNGLDPDALEQMLDETEGVRCVMTDADPDGALFGICRKHNVPMILNMGGVFPRDMGGKADAFVFSLEEGSGLYAGKGGFIASDNVEVYAGAFAYHNCGRG